MTTDVEGVRGNAEIRRHRFARSAIEVYPAQRLGMLLRKPFHELVKTLTHVVLVVDRCYRILVQHLGVYLGSTKVGDSVAQDAVEPRIQTFVILELVDGPGSARKGALKNLISQMGIAHPPTDEGPEAFEIVCQVLQ